MGGEYYSANRKNRDHAEIRQTPVIITGNYPNVLPNDEAFVCRVDYYHWQNAPFLKDNGSKALHPLCLLELIRAVENFFEESLFDV